MNTIPNRIKELRNQKGMTLRNLSTATGFTTSSISRWENGIRGVDKKKAIILAKALGVEPSELFVSNKNTLESYWNTEKNITFIRDKYVVSIMRKGKNYSKSFEKLEEAIKHRDMVLKDYKETGVLPKKRIEEVISKYQELIGRRFQNLTVIDVVGPKKKKGVKRTYTYLLCRCDCGNSCEIELFDLINGSTLSCGCFALNQIRKLGEYFGKDRETTGKRTISNILNPNPRKTNKSTQIKNITYSSKFNSYRVQITRKGRHYRKRFPTLDAAIEYKETILKQLDKIYNEEKVENCNRKDKI